jgi:hypothetical protein
MLVFAHCVMLRSWNLSGAEVLSELDMCTTCAVCCVARVKSIFK